MLAKSFISNYKFIIISLIALFFFNRSSEAQYSDGTGEANNPYQIASADDLILLGESPDDYDKNFILTADIDLSGHAFTAAVIASDPNASNDMFDGTAFTGVFDGNGHKIINLTIDDGGAGNNYLGLFGYNSGKITNLGIEGGYVTGRTCVGVLVGENGINGYILNCYSATDVSGSLCTGGIAGQNSGTVSNCYSTGNVGYDNSAGGLIGSNSGIVLHSYSSSEVIGTINEGGLIGYNSGTVCNCFATGDVIGEGRYVGGLVGYISSASSIVLNCYSVSIVNGDRYVGGLVGKNSWNSIISNCYSASDVNGNQQVGGLAGDSGGIISNCFWAIDAQSHGIAVGIGNNTGTSNVVDLTEAQMQMEDSFISAGWDFINESAKGTSETWQMSGSGPVLSFVNSDVPYPLAGGGTEMDPYVISTAQELGMISWYPQGSFFRLSSNIDLSGISWSVPVIPIFTGYFDGNNHIITNMQITGISYLGMFGILGKGSQIMNLGVEASSVNGTKQYIGGLVGKNGDWINPGGTITNCYWEGTLKGESMIGGLIGQNCGSDISDCHSIVDVNATGSYVGGLVGFNSIDIYPQGSITNCYSNGNIYGLGSYIGGLAGYNYRNDISNCYCIVDVNGQNGWRIGGLIGSNRDSNVSNCYSRGDVNGIEVVGGLIGDNGDSIVENCYSTGSVTGYSFVAGLVGQNTAGIVRNCFSIGYVQSVYSENPRLGGLCASHGSSGGIINCFWNIDTAGVSSSAGGWAMTTQQMMSESTYVGWNNGAWVIDEGMDYPHLLWEGTVGEVIDYEYPQTYPGNGLDQPFVIDSSEDVICMSLRPADWDKNFILTADIDMSSVADYRPVGLFEGILNGQDHVVANLTVDSGILGNRTHLGFFGKIGEGSQVINLGVQDINIIGSDYCRYLGGLCGENIEGTIINCFITGSVTGGIMSDDLGGLCGDNDEGTISGCSTICSVTSGENSHDLGGICGINKGVITGCFASGDISSSTRLSEVGGLCGENEDGTIIGSNATVSITTGEFSTYLGGLIGISSGGTIRNCSSKGAINSGRNSWQVGGLVGFNSDGIISGSYSNSPITFTEISTYHVGGLVGRNVSSTISNCYATGSISMGEGSIYAGGLVGYNEAGTIRNCYSIGSVSDGTDIGGLCGHHSVSGGIINSFWDKDASGNLYSAGGLAMTTAEMMSESTYVGWNNGLWVIDEGMDYPHLLWEGTAGEVIDYEYTRIYPGNGQDQPFELDSADDMLCMTLRPDDWDKNFILTSDIDMSSVIYYKPPVPFTGTFDGQNHVLKNLTIDANVIGSRFHLGVFGKIEEDGVVANLGVVDVNIIGGDECRYVGGLCGENAEGLITCCFTTGSVSGGAYSDDLGGLCGDNERGTITQSFSDANVSAGESSHDLGGLCGKNEGFISDCYATGTVSGYSVNVNEVGGLCGENNRRGSLTNCYSIGAASGASDIGGLCGDNESGNVYNCLWDKEASGNITSDGGTGLTTALMQIQSTFTDLYWDFVGETVNGTEDIWWIDEGNDYPRLWWEVVLSD